jgi:hypothetical protein
MLYSQNDIIKAKKIIHSAICGYASLFDEDILNDKFFKILFNHVNVNNIPEKTLLSNKRIYDNINWNLVEKKKLLRLIMRDSNIINFIDLNKVNFDFSEIISLLIYQPGLVNYFNINVDELTPMDAINLMYVIPEYVEKIDLKKYKFSKREIVSISEKLYNNEAIMKSLNLKLLDNFETRRLMIKTGDKYINILDLSTLTAYDWIPILVIHNNLLNYCDINVFTKNDCYNLIKFIKIFPEFEYLILENVKNLSPLGLEEVILFDNKFLDIIDLNKLDKVNWHNLVSKQPSLKNIMSKYIFLK